VGLKQLAHGHRFIATQNATESVYRRYAIVDAKSMRAAAEKLGELHQQQAQAPRKVVPMERRG